MGVTRLSDAPIHLCLWFDRDAEEAARFYAGLFPDSAVTAVHRAPGDFPSGKEGDVLTVEFTVLGIPCLGLNGGQTFKHSEAFSFQVATTDQAETDRYAGHPDRANGSDHGCRSCRSKAHRALHGVVADGERACGVSPPPPAERSQQVAAKGERAEPGKPPGD